MNIVFIASLHYGTKEKDKSFWHKCRYTETITWWYSEMISKKHAVDVFHYFSHLIRANECRNTQFINGTKKLEAHLVFADYSYLVSSWNWIPMSFRMICDILQWCNEMLASCKSKVGFERQCDIFGWKRGPATRNREAPRLVLAMVPN